MLTDAKVKCDERPQACLNCQRLGVECSGYMPGPLKRSVRLQIMRRSAADETVTEAGTQRKRLLESCQACRVAKTKCSGDNPNCARCFERGIKCHYKRDRSRRRGQSSTDDELSTASRDNQQSEHLRVSKPTPDDTPGNYSPHIQRLVEYEESESRSRSISCSEQNLNIHQDLGAHSW